MSNEIEACVFSEWYLLILGLLKLVAINHVWTSFVLSMFSALKCIGKFRIHISSVVAARVDDVSTQILYHLSKCALWKKKNLSSMLGSFQQFSSSACNEVETYLSSFIVCMWTWQQYCSFQKFLSICTALPHVKSSTLLLFSCIFSFVVPTVRYERCVLL